MVNADSIKLETAQKWKQTKQQLIVAIDHGLSFPQMKGLEDPFQILELIAENDDIDGVIASYGIYRQAERLGIELQNKKRFLLIDYAAVAKQNGREILSEREMIVEPEETQLVNPHAFKMFLNVYEDDKQLYRNCRDLERFATYGAKHNISTLAEIMFYGNQAFENPQTKTSELMRGCRIAMELGADALKIPYVEDLSVIEEISDKLKLPIYLLGGSKEQDHAQFLKRIQQVCQTKIDGLMFGRNIWQSENMQQIIQEIVQIMGENACEDNRFT